MTTLVAPSAGGAFPVASEEAEVVSEAAHRCTILSKGGLDLGRPDAGSATQGGQSLDFSVDGQALREFVETVPSGQCGNLRTVDILAEERMRANQAPKPIVKIKATELGALLAPIRAWGEPQGLLAVRRSRGPDLATCRGARGARFSPIGLAFFNLRWVSALIAAPAGGSTDAGEEHGSSDPEDGR